MITATAGVVALTFAGTVIVAAVTQMLTDEVIGWFALVPHGILRLVALRLPTAQRKAVYDDEWLPELTFVLHEAEGRPLTRLVRGIWFSVSMFRAVGTVGRNLAGVRDTLQTSDGAAQPLVLAARRHFDLGQFEKARQLAVAALVQATEAGDNWSIGWALHVQSAVTANQKQVADALPLFERALTVIQSDPTLNDLRPLLLVNQAVALGDLDQYESAFAVAREAQQLADHAGPVVRQAQAHNTLGQLLFDTGQWDEASAEVEALAEDDKNPATACCDHGIAAVIYFHRGEAHAARRQLAAAAPYAKEVGNRVIASLALGHSLDAEHSGAPAEALAVLTAGFTNNAEELPEIEDLLPDAVRLAVRVGNVSMAQTLTGHAEALARDTEVPHRRANALYCRGLLDHDPAPLLQAAKRYRDACRPLLRAQALEAAVSVLLDNGDYRAAQAAATRAVEVYVSLNATSDVVRLRTLARTHSIWT